MGHKCSEFTPPVVKLGPHVAPLGMKFYTGNQFPAEYKNGIFIAEHGSWNRAKKNGYRIVFISVDPDGKNPKETVFARAAGSTTRRSSAVPPTSCRRPTARCWSPTTRPARSTRSATRSSRSCDSPPAATAAGGPSISFVLSTMPAQNASPVLRRPDLPLRSRPSLRRPPTAGAGQAPAIVQTCAACHGPRAYRRSTRTPSLAGQPDIFTQYQLVFMRDGVRKPGVMAGGGQEPDRREDPRPRRLLRSAAAAAAAQDRRADGRRAPRSMALIEAAPLRQLPQGGFLRPGRDRPAGRAAAGISDEGPDGLSRRRAARARAWAP